MIQSLHIEKSLPGQYLARVMNEHSEALSFTASSIAGAIRNTAQMLPKARAFHIWYEHVSIGTAPVLHMQNDPETLASRLKLLHGQFWGRGDDEITRRLARVIRGVSVRIAFGCRSTLSSPTRHPHVAFSRLH